MSIVGYEEEANRFLANLIPEMLYIHGPNAAKWFTSTGISMYQNIHWNAKKGTATASSNAKDSAALVKEDIWD
jgi:hypothetical protein